MTVQLSSVHDGMCMHAVTKERGEHGRRGKKRGETSFVLFGSMLVEKLEGGGGYQECLFSCTLIR